MKWKQKTKKHKKQKKHKTKNKKTKNNKNKMKIDLVFTYAGTTKKYKFTILYNKLNFKVCTSRCTVYNNIYIYVCAHFPRRHLYRLPP